MKYLAYIFFFLFLVYLQPKAQIIRAELQAAGLTCAMCSNAIYKSLKTLKFIGDVDVDLNRSSFRLVFKRGEDVSFEDVREKVEDAGFSLSSFVFTVDLTNYDWVEKKSLRLNGSSFCLLNSPLISLNKKQNLKIVNRGFIPDKEYKKYAKVIIADACSLNTQEKIYYVVMAEQMSD